MCLPPKKLLVILLCSVLTITSAQETTTKIPRKAAIYSAIIPGGGQIYTKKYWKIPIIYAGFVTSLYYIKESNKSYELYKQIYLDRMNNIANASYEQYSNSCFLHR